MRRLFPSSPSSFRGRNQRRKSEKKQSPLVIFRLRRSRPDREWPREQLPISSTSGLLRGRRGLRSLRSATASRGRHREPRPSRPTPDQGGESKEAIQSFRQVIEIRGILHEMGEIVSLFLLLPIFLLFLLLLCHSANNQSPQSSAPDKRIKASHYPAAEATDLGNLER